jgi:hypothetical protein
MTVSRGILPPRVFWTTEQLEIIRARYPHESTEVLARAIGRSRTSVYAIANRLGLSKTDAFLQSPGSHRLQKGTTIGQAFWFKKGNVAKNKGHRCPGYGPGRMKETQFKKGHRGGVALEVYRPIGSERIGKGGYLQRKIHDGWPLQSRWRAVHLILWEQANGPLPKGHAVIFINGDRSDIRLDNLACITRRELMARNSVHNLPKPLAQTVQLLGRLNRQLRKRTHAQEQNHRSS